MVTWLQLLTYASIIFFALVTISKVTRVASAPIHLRWELYPVPHEKGKSYGGSFFEELNWWTKPRETSLVAEIAAMLSEIIFLTALWHHNRKLWYLSYPFHAGIYFSVGWIVLLLAGAILQIAGVPIGPTSGLAWLNYLTVVVGVVGMVGVTVGALGLLLRRLFSEELRIYSAPSDYVNLLFVLAVSVSALYAWLTVDQSFDQIRSFVHGIITFTPVTESAPVMVEMVAVSLFLIYMPFTHMIHWAAKYFTYHKIRWDDQPNLRETNLEPKIMTNLQRPVSWSAPHIQPGKSWAEVATTEVE